ncbi:serine/arginine repetitive matrix protein 2-like isoform X2 [Prinia subflava]|uniref:serine/arginine repetitive matrix protein 2-like isoform X2 n=1 Tax=Prinia subflava TaxID=208062 RepID=UPI002FE2E88D
MEAIAKVVSVIHRQWEIECKPRDLQLALARLLELGVIERPVEILHSEVWGRCTLALAEDTESTGSGKHLKAWGRVKQSLRKALEEQETWSAARVCLLATPKLGVGATTQTAFENDLSECEKPREPSTLPPSRSPSPKSPVPSGNPPTPTPSPSASPPPAEPSRASGGPSSVPLPSIGGSVPEARQRGRFFWQGLAEEARDAEHVAQESTRPAPPPYGFENGAGGSGEGRGLNVCGGESPEPWVCASAHAQGKAGEEGEKCVLGQEPRASAGACAQQEGRGCMFGAAPRVPAGACAPGSGGESAPGPAPWASAGACAPGGGGEGAFGEAPPFPADVHTRESRGERPRSSEPWFSADPHARDSGEERVRASGPRFPAGTHVREGREEHVSRRELRSALPAFRGETSPRKRQGKPRGREQSHPREGGRERSHPREGGRERSHPREGGRERSHPREGGREWSHPREGGREWSHPREEGRGRSRTERHSNPEVSWQCVSDSLSDSTGGSSSGEQTESDWDSETKRAEPTRFKMKPNKAFSHSKKSLQHEPAQVTDWGKIKIACAEWTPASTVKAFPVRVARIEDNQQKIYTPVNPKDIQTIVKAIPEKRNEPRAPKCPTPVRPRQQRCFCMILLLGLVARMQASPDYYPHQPFRWDTPRRGITLSQVTGQGKCFGSATLAKQKGNVCTEVVKPDKKINKWVIPAASGMWVCQRSGVSPCVSLAKFNDSDDFCIQVLIVPRVLYRSDEEVCQLSEEPGRLHKREIITGVTIAMLLGLGAAGTATGVSALVTQHQGLSQLQVTIDEDLQRIEKSISFLEKSVSSLSEVVLQNRRGLDLLFMQQGGLCAALKEECCFYADHTGVVRDSMAELRDRLAQKKKDREAQQGWFESWFNQSPWLTTLISTLIGPLAMLLLALAIGPCLLNKLVTFIQTRLERANILFVGQQQLL